MKRRLLLFLLVFPVFAFAQNNGSVKGLVSDSLHDYGLQSATVTIYKKADSALVNYQITNTLGEFNIAELPLNTPLLVSVTYSGYDEYSKVVTLDTTQKTFDFKKINMSHGSAEEMQEVVIEAVAPVRMNGDTLEINPRAFKLDSAAVVEDMLLRVPGVTLWSDGAITVNGKKVTNVFVDGKPFFGNNPEIATQNLPKNAIEKIQVYQEKDYNKTEVTNTEADSTYTMNIKLRADKKKGYFGKASAGIGTDKRYEADLTVQGFSKKTRLGIAGNFNNINKSVGDVQSAFQNNTFRSYNRRWSSSPSLGEDGITTIQFFGANFQQSFKDDPNTRFDNTLGATYNLNGSQQDQSSNSTSIQDLKDSTFTTIGNAYTNRSTLSQNVNANYQNRNRDQSFSLATNYAWNKSDSHTENENSIFKDDTALTSTSKNRSDGQSQSKSLNINGSFNNNDNDEGINKKSFSTNFNVALNDQESESKRLSEFNSIVNPARSTQYDRLYNNQSSNLNTNLSLNYNGLRSLLFGNYNFWNINIALRNNFRYNKSDLQARVSDFDSTINNYIINDALTNNNTVINIENRPGIGFSKNFAKYLTDRFYSAIHVKADFQDQMVYQKNTSTLSYRNVERTYQFFTPTSSVAYSYQKFNAYNINMSLNHNSSATAPTIDQLYPIRDSINRLNIVVGNPNLKSSFGNTFGFNFTYNSQKYSANTTYNAGLSVDYSTVKNGVSDSSIYDGSGGRTRYLINIDNRNSLNGNWNASASFKMKQNMLQVRYNGSFTNSNAPQYINSDRLFSKNTNINNTVNLFYNIVELFNISLAQSLNTTTNQQAGSSNPLSKAKTYTTRGSFNLTYPKNFTLSSTVSYLNNISAQNAAVTATIWNAYATYRFMRQQGELRLSAFDLLRQNKNIDNFSNDNTTTTRITSGLQQFYMLTFSYYPRRFGDRSGKSSRSSSRKEAGERRQRSERSPGKTPGRNKN